MDVYVTGEPAGTWETATENSGEKTYEVDVTGIDDMEALEQYLNDIGAVGYEMVNGKKVYVRFAQNPSANTSVGVMSIYNLIQGTAGYLTGYQGSGFWTRVASSVALDAIMRSMYVTMDAAEMAANLKDRVAVALNNFKIIDGETVSDDIPLYVGSDGTAYMMEDIIESIRNILIELGAYGSGEFTPPASIDSDKQLRINANTITITPAQYANALSTVKFMDGVHYPNNNGNIPAYAIGDVTGNRYAVLNSACAIYANLNTRYCFASYQIENVSASDFTVKLYDADDTAISGNIYYFRVTYDGEEICYASVNSGGSVTSPIYLNFKERNGITVEGEGDPTSSSNQVPANVAYMFLEGTASASLPGVAPAADMPVGFGDLALPLDDVVPGWAARKKQVATPKGIAGDEDVWAKTPALPLNIPLGNVWDDGYAGDSADTYDGDIADILKDAIVDAIPDILDAIIEDTAVTEDDVYRIPIDDSGDTPSPMPPVLDGSSNGLWTMYAPDKQEVNAFGAWLWSDTIIDQIIRQFNSPIDAIIGFHQIYCTPDKGADKVIKAGYLNSPVSAPEITNQYKTINCGTVHVDEFYGNVLDYDNTQVSIYLPFVGIVPLNTNIVMGSDLEVIYRIDVFTGTCLAQIVVHKDASHAVMYAFEGNCAVQIPLTATTYTGMVGALISGISAGVSFMEGDMLHATASGLSAVMSGLTGRTGTKQSGSMGSNAGSLGIRKPYLIITRAISAMPAGFESVAGLPSTELTALSSVSGFTVVRNVHLEGIPGTAEELEEIKGLLESGVIF